MTLTGQSTTVTVLLQSRQILRLRTCSKFGEQCRVFVSFAEREVHQAAGHPAQLPEDRPVHVQEQLSSQQPGEAAGPEGHCGPSHQHYVL